MAVKRVDLPGIGIVTLQKRRGNKSLRISINSRGEVKVTLPPWAPYHMAANFALARASWITKHRPDIAPLQDKTSIGKAHHLVFLPNERISTPRTNIRGNEIVVHVPAGYDKNDKRVQGAAHKAIIRALKYEAESLLPGRLAQLAEAHGFAYKSVTIKRLSSRWGSCDSHKNITLNCYLMQLPWRLIDYVLLHELVHTRIMAHGTRFWDELAEYVPDLATIRKEIRTTRPAVNF